MASGLVLWLQLPPNGSGSLVFKIDPLAPAAGTLEINDVVLEIEGVPIADDGTVEFRNEERVEFSHIVRSKHIGGAATQLLRPSKYPICVHRSSYCLSLPYAVAKMQAV